MFNVYVHHFIHIFCFECVYGASVFGFRLGRLCRYISWFVVFFYLFISCATFQCAWGANCCATLCVIIVLGVSRVRPDSSKALDDGAFGRCTRSTARFERKNTYRRIVCVCSLCRGERCVLCNRHAVKKQMYAVCYSQCPQDERSVLGRPTSLEMVFWYLFWPPINWNFTLRSDIMEAFHG